MSEKLSIDERYLWTEIYRPKKLENLVISDDYMNIFKSWIEQKDLPHCLLWGPPGSGKTTLARILVNKVPTDKKNDVLILNGSVTTSIESVRNLIEEFCMTPSFGSSPKICFIDEFEYMSPNAQAALRNIMERYYENCRFLLTCNFLHKVISPLQSRCQTFEFKKLPLDYVKKFITGILEKENVKYDEKLVNKIINLYYPDIRKIINTLQSRVYNNVLVSDIKNLDNYEKKIRSYLTDIFVCIKDGNSKNINGIIKSIINILSESDIDFPLLYEELFFDENVPMWSKPIINDYYNKHENNCASYSMNFMSCVFSIFRTGVKLENATTK